MFWIVLPWFPLLMMARLSRLDRSLWWWLSIPGSAAFFWVRWKMISATFDWSNGGGMALILPMSYDFLAFLAAIILTAIGRQFNEPPLVYRGYMYRENKEEMTRD
ncbi:MAG: hypothetical protein WA906_06110 [Pacificimonas sp.]